MLFMLNWYESQHLGSIYAVSGSAVGQTLNLQLRI